MMNHEQKQLVLKDLSARLTYGVKCEVYDCLHKNVIETSAKLTSISSTWFQFNYGMGFYGTFMYVAKPYLFPLSSITDGQRKELKEILNCDGLYFDECLGEDKFIEWIVGGSVGCETFTFNIQDLARVFDFFHRHHLDYRNLIPQDLAIDATNLNVY